MASTATTKMDQLKAAYTAGDDKKAEKIALALLKQKTSAPTAVYALGLIKHDQKDHPAAIAYFEQALLLDRQQERTALTYYWIGRSYEDSASWQNPREYEEKRDKAREAYEKATECGSYPVEVIRRLALLHPFGYPRMKWYGIGIEQFPQEFPFYIYSSWIYRKENQPIRQLEILQEGLNKNPDSPSLLFQLVQYYYTHQRFDDSLAAILSAIEKNHEGCSMDSLHYFAGSIHLAKGHWDKAILHFEYSIQACANSNAIWYGVCGLIVAYQKKRKLTEARKYIDGAILDRSIFEYIDFRYGLLSNLEGQTIGETGFLQAESDIIPYLKQLHEESTDATFKTKTAIVLSALGEYFDRHEDRFTYVRYALKHSEEVSYLEVGLSDAYQELATSRAPSPQLVEQLHEDLEPCLTEDRASAIISTFVEKLFAEKKYSEIVKLCSPLHQNYLKKSQKEFEYAYALSETGKQQEAKTQFEHYLKSHPMSSAARNNLAVILRDKEQFEAAIALFNEAADLEPGKDLYKTNLQKTIELQEKKRRSDKAKKIPEHWASCSSLLTVEKLEELEYFALHDRIHRVSSKYRPLLQRDWEELVFNYNMRNYKSTVILSGSFVELLLTYYCERKKIKTIPIKGSNGQVTSRKLYDCVLNELIGYVQDQRWFGADFSHLGNLARVYRNLIHPGLELKSYGNIKSKAELCFISAKEILQKIL